MSQRYTEEEKEIALDRLYENGGNIAHTSLETGIPARTLYAWRTQLQQIAATAPPSPPQQNGAAITGDMDDVEVLTTLHDNLIGQLQHLSAHAATGIELASPYQRILAMSELIRNIHRIKDAIALHNPPALRVEYVNPDGTVGDKPFWALPKKEKPDDDE